MTHRQRYPEQYTGPFIGLRATVRTLPTVPAFTIERVVPSRFGWLVPDPRDHRTAYRLQDLEVHP